MVADVQGPQAYLPQAAGWQEACLPSLARPASPTTTSQHAKPSAPLSPAEAEVTSSIPGADVTSNSPAEDTTAAAFMRSASSGPDQEDITSPLVQPLDLIRRLEAQEALTPVPDTAQPRFIPLEACGKPALLGSEVQRTASPSFAQGHARFISFLSPSGASSSARMTHADVPVMSTADEPAAAIDDAMPLEAAKVPAALQQIADDLAVEALVPLVSASPCVEPTLQGEAFTKLSGAAHASSSLRSDLESQMPVRQQSRMTAVPTEALTAPEASILKAVTAGLDVLADPVLLDAAAHPRCLQAAPQPDSAVPPEAAVDEQAAHAAADPEANSEAGHQASVAEMVNDLTLNDATKPAEAQAGAMADAKAMVGEQPPSPEAVGLCGALAELPEDGDLGNGRFCAKPAEAQDAEADDTRYLDPIG